MVAIDKNEVILEQYNLKINKIYRVKGAIILDTTEGQKIMREYKLSEGKAKIINMVMQHLAASGFENVDVICENKKGNLVTENQYGNRFVIRNYFPGEECDLKSEKDVLAAVNGLARIHTILHGVDFSFLNNINEENEMDEYIQAASMGEIRYGVFDSSDRDDLINDIEGVCSPKLMIAKRDIRENLYNHSKEIKRVFRYICDKKKKNDFEVEFLNTYSNFKEQPVKALEIINDFEYDKLLEKTYTEGRIIHGEFTQHNIIFQDDMYAFTGFEKVAMGIQVYDVYRFLRKIMEKNMWNYEMGNKIIHNYFEERRELGNHVSQEEIKVLYSLLVFPEKLWKITDYYYNRRKSWISYRMIEKLKGLREQEESRRVFIESFSREYLG